MRWLTQVSPAVRRIVVEGIHQGTVAVHQNGPTVSILLVRLHPQTEQQQHAPVPAAIQGRVEFGAGPLEKRGRGDEEDKVHPHLLVVAPERSAVDKLLAKKVLVPDIKAAEDLDFWPFTTPAAALVANSLLHAPHQPVDMTITELIVLSIRRREPKAREPVAAIVVQIMGDFFPEIFQRPMLCNVISVCLSGLGGPDFFAQGCKSILPATIVPAMQAMRQPVSGLCPPPDIALECICQTALGFPASRPIIAPGSKQDSPSP